MAFYYYVALLVQQSSEKKSVIHTVIINGRWRFLGAEQRTR